MSGYSLTTAAQADMRSIRRYYQREAGYGIARQMNGEFVSAFRAIARNPGIGHKREDLAGDRVILFWPVRDFLILYRTVATSTEILMVVRGSRDIAQLVRRRGL